MTGIAIAGAGAFGTALAITLARQNDDVILWARDAKKATQLQTERANTRYLPNVPFPHALNVSSGAIVFSSAATTLLVIPTQQLRGFLQDHANELSQGACVLCCKGVEAGTGLLPGQVLQEFVPNAKTAILTGPGFAAEIAMNKPTALTLASTGSVAKSLQSQLSTPTFRLYLSDDPVGAQLGGALKNVVAIACGIVMGAQLGESARASLMTRGYAEILRLAVDMGAKPATLAGLSGFGDLALTCTSEQSRNFSLGYRLGRGKNRQIGKTYEGVATAQAVVELAEKRGIDMPITQMVAGVLREQMTIEQAVRALLSRPLKQEF